jgi:hypothetical protein
MRWDETRFGREYDLDVFNLVAVSDFNMGAMENKGLNIFNTKYVLARPDTATDVDYAGIEGVGHLIDEIENNPGNAALKARGVLVYVSSDFGRTAYNGGEDDGARGKDHWPVTSAMVIGLGAMRTQVSGGTAIGLTTPFIDGVLQPGLRAMPLRFDGNDNLVPGTSPTQTGAGLFALTATEMNFALRDALGLNDEVPAAGTSRLVDRFALPEVDAGFTAVLGAGRLRVRLARGGAATSGAAAGSAGGSTVSRPVGRLRSSIG